MGIDGISKVAPGTSSVPLEAPTAASTTGASAPFSLEPSSSPVAVGDTPFARLERGELSLDQYFDLRVESATAHLQQLAPGDVAFIRETLRTELARDPALVELARRATGAVPVDSEP